MKEYSRETERRIMAFDYTKYAGTIEAPDAVIVEAVKLLRYERPEDAYKHPDFEREPACPGHDPRYDGVMPARYTDNELAVAMFCIRAYVLKDAHIPMGLFNDLKWWVYNHKMKRASSKHAAMLEALTEACAQLHRFYGEEEQACMFECELEFAFSGR